MSRRFKGPDGEDEEGGFFKTPSPAHAHAYANAVGTSIGPAPRDVIVPHSSTEKKSGIIGASFNLINSIIGAGLVGLPAAVQECGLWAGCALLVLLALMIEKSLILMIECGIKEKQKNLEELCLVLYGPIGYYVTAVFMFSYSFGSMVACMMVIGDTIPLCLHFLFDVAVDRHLAMIACGLFIILPLCMLRNMASLSSWSFLSFCGVVVLVVLVCVRGPVVSTHPFDLAQDATVITPHIFMGIGTISFHYVCQQSAFLVFGSMEEETIQAWGSVTLLSMMFGFLLSVTIGIWGYVCFNEAIEVNILNNFSEYDTAITVARLGMAVNMIFTFPMECFVVRHAALSVVNRLYFLDESGATDSPSASNIAVDTADTENSPPLRRKHTPRPLEIPATLVAADASWGLCAHVLVTLWLWSAAVMLSLKFSDLSVVLQLSGIVAGSMLGFVIPSMAYLKSYEREISVLLYMQPNDAAEAELLRSLVPRLVQALLLCLFGVFALGSGLATMATHRADVVSGILPKQ